MAYKEYGIQDVNTCEASQQMLEARIVSEFPFNDQEILSGTCTCCASMP